MSFGNIKFVLLCVCLIALSLIFESSSFKEIRFHSDRFSGESKRWCKFDSVPYTAKANGSKFYEYTGQLTRGSLGSPTIHVKPDNKIISIKVNGEAVDLSDFNSKELFDIVNGVYIPLASVLQSGENSLYLLIEDFGGDTGLKIKPLPSMRLIVSLTGLIFLCLVSIIFLCSFAGIDTRYERTLRGVINKMIAHQA